MNLVIKRLVRVDYGCYNLGRLTRGKIREEIFYDKQEIQKLNNIYPLTNYKF